MKKYDENDMTCWRWLVEAAMQDPDHGSGDTWSDVIGFFGDLDRMFDDSFGGEEGLPFTLWTTKNVYFPVCYDGSESVGWAPRNPCDFAVTHWGG